MSLKLRNALGEEKGTFKIPIVMRHKYRIGAAPDDIRIMSSNFIKNAKPKTKSSQSHETYDHLSEIK